MPHVIEELLVARKRKQDAQLGVGLLLLAIVGFPIWLFSKASDAIGPAGVVFCVLCILAAMIFFVARKRTARRAHLLSKYGDPAIVDAIMRKKFWEGQTHLQLVDSIGLPAAIDDQYLKTKKKQIWKYNPDGRNRYKLRIIVEDDVVVGWDKRS